MNVERCCAQATLKGCMAHPQAPRGTREMGRTCQEMEGVSEYLVEKQDRKGV